MPSVVEEEFDAGSSGLIGGSGGLGIGMLTLGSPTFPSQTESTFDVSSNAVSPIEEVADGSVAAEASIEESGSITSSIPLVSSPVSVPTGPATLSDLVKVWALIDSSKCYTVSTLVSETGLDKAVIQECIELLRKHKAVGNSAGFYCGPTAMDFMITQITACKNCK
jgi:hypothetical protein